jgi:hypothetical protein
MVKLVGDEVVYGTQLTPPRSALLDACQWRLSAGRRRVTRQCHMIPISCFGTRVSTKTRLKIN